MINGEEWFTTEQVAEEFGMTPASVRTNFPRRYRVRPQGDMWLKADIEAVRTKRRMRSPRKAA